MRKSIPLQENWRVQQLTTQTPNIDALTHSALDSNAEWFPTRVPAQVHEILLANGKIPDPYISKNAAESAWVGEQDWVYATTFVSPPGEGLVFLRLDGLDTLATVYLNGQEMGRFEDMFRRYRLSIRPALRPEGQENVLLVIFSSAARYIRQAEAQWGPLPGVTTNHYIRKCHSDFSSYMGARPDSIKVGIYDQVWLDLPGPGWLENAWVRPRLLDGFEQAEVAVTLDLQGAPCEVTWKVTDPDGQPVLSEPLLSEPLLSEPLLSGRLPAGQSALVFSLDHPRLWWPNTHGASPLYQLHLEISQEGEVCDRKTIPFGVQRVQPVLSDPNSGEKRFAFEINGQRIFLRGACWSLLEGMTHVWDEARASRLLDLLVQGNMNVLRIWAEGIIPPQSFYDECDRRGILIWQDFMFGYNAHPSQVPGFLETCRLELEDTVTRLRNHPSLLLWCGGNENYMGWDFQFHAPTGAGWELFTQLMPEVVARLDPDRLFQRSSPFGGEPAPNWPLEGDWHDYTTISFSPEASVPLFASEIGRTSAPSAASMRRFLSEEELWPAGFDARVRNPGQPAWPPMWGYRAPDGAWSKIGSIEAYCDPTTPEELVRVLGTAHGEYLQQRVERQRRGVPDGQPDGSRRCWGNTIWRLNDSWPILYWSAVDYYLEPKIPYYFLKRAYQPVLVCFEQTADRIFAWVVNDSPEPVSAELVVRRMNFHGNLLGELKADVALAAGASKRCLDLTPFGPILHHTDFLVAEFAGSQNTHLLKAERHLHLPEAHLSAHWTEGQVRLSSDTFARQVTLEFPGLTGAVFEDNFFDLLPGQTRQVRILHSAGGDRLAIRAVNAAPVEVKIA